VIALGFTFYCRLALELEGAPSFASFAKGGFLRSGATGPLLSSIRGFFLLRGTDTLVCALGFRFSAFSVFSVVKLFSSLFFRTS
jgi:hypothetical protein